MPNNKLMPDERHLVCPRCEHKHDILSLITLGEVPKYTNDTCPIYKCPDCKWVFALRFEGFPIEV